MLIYTEFITDLIRDIAGRVEALAHIDVRRVAVAAAPRWAGRTWGNLATCIALRGGATHDERDGSESDRAPDGSEGFAGTDGSFNPEDSHANSESPGAPEFSIWFRGRSKKVIEVSPWRRRVPVRIESEGEPCLYLILLRLPRLLEHNPLETIVHEMLHIGEDFDGHLRPLRHGRQFDWLVHQYMRQWLAQADAQTAELAQMKLDELLAREGTIAARRLPARFRPIISVPAVAPYSYEEGVARHYPRYRLARTYRINKGAKASGFTPREVPRTITLEDCPLRIYDEKGSHAMPRAMERYMRQGERPAAVASLTGAEPTEQNSLRSPDNV